MSVFLSLLGIKEIDNLNYLPALDNLNLSRNCIYRIKGLNVQLSIRELNLAHNFIERIQGLEELVHLAVLDLSYNKIADIKEVKNLKKNKKLHSLSIEENPFVGIKYIPFNRNRDYEKVVVTYLPFLVELDSKPIIHAKQLSRENSRDLQKLVADMKKEFDRLQFDSTAQTDIGELRRLSIDLRQGESLSSTVRSPIGELKRSAFNLRKEGAEGERRLRQERKNVLIEGKEMNKTFAKHLATKAFQNTCSNFIEPREEIQREDIKRMFNEKKKMVINKGKMSTKLLDDSLAHKQANPINTTKENGLCITNREAASTTPKLTTQAKQFYSALILKKVSGAMEETVRRIEEKMSAAMGKYEEALEQLSRYHGLLQGRCREETESARIMKCVIERLRGEKEKVEASCAKLEEDNRAIRTELSKCKAALENARVTCQQEVFINTTRTDEYYAIEAELNKSRADYLKLEVKTTKEQNGLINEKNKYLKLTSEMRKSMEALKTAHAKELQKLKKEHEAQIASKDTSLSSVVAERDSMLKELSTLRAKFGNKKADKQTMTVEEPSSKKYKNTFNKI